MWSSIIFQGEDCRGFRQNPSYIIGSTFAQHFLHVNPSWMSLGWDLQTYALSSVVWLITHCFTVKVKGPHISYPFSLFSECRKQQVNVLSCMWSSKNMLITMRVIFIWFVAYFLRKETLFKLEWTTCGFVFISIYYLSAERLEFSTILTSGSVY